MHHTNKYPQMLKVYFLLSKVSCKSKQFSGTVVLHTVVKWYRQAESSPFCSHIIWNSQLFTDTGGEENDVQLYFISNQKLWVKVIHLISTHQLLNTRCCIHSVVLYTLCSLGVMDFKFSCGQQFVYSGSIFNVCFSEFHYTEQSRRNISMSTSIPMSILISLSST